MWVFPVYCRCWYVYSVLSAVLSKIVPVLSKNSETAVIRTFLISRDFCGATAKKAFNIKHFRQIQSRPKPPSKITKQPLTYKTRNQLGSNPPRVRISPSPPHNHNICDTSENPLYIRGFQHFRTLKDQVFMPGFFFLFYTSRKSCRDFRGVQEIFVECNMRVENGTL